MQKIKFNTSYHSDFVDQVMQESAENPFLCYQCGKCTAGCPYTFVFDIPVHQIMRMLQAGLKEQILNSHSLWLCATCESCTTRCPNNIDIAKTMDVLRHIARREGYVREKQVKLFNDSFLESVKKHGRVFELGTLVNYVTRTGRFFTDFDLSPKIIFKGKIAARAHEIQGKEEVNKIFKRFRGEKEQ